MLYQTLFAGKQQKGADDVGKDLKGKKFGVGVCQRKVGLYAARFMSKQKDIIKTVSEVTRALQMQGLKRIMAGSMLLVI